VALVFTRVPHVGWGTATPMTMIRRRPRLFFEDDDEDIFIGAATPLGCAV
jgi:hypothetical protein